MKMTQYLLIVLMAGALALVGCGKSNKQAPAAQQTPGVVDLNALQTAFPDPTPEVQAILGKLRFNQRYGFHDKNLPELETLSALPNLTEPQKKAIADVTEQVKAAIAAQPPPAQ
jgi:hypothetical protein